MTKDESSHEPVSRDASSQPTFVALFAVSLLATAACSSATIEPGQSAGGGGNGSGGVGGSGTTGGGGIIIDFDAHVPAADARGTGIDRPGGGTCGDGIIERSEQCDDGNTTNADGCSRLCQIEANWDCPTEGQPCVYVGNCGSGRLTSNKVCDDGNTKSGDGCSGDCKTVETGYICRVPGRALLHAVW